MLDQLEPVFLEVANGAKEFVPAPEDTKNLIRRYYGVKRNLLFGFRDDSIDETSRLAATLTDSSAIAETLDLSVRSLSGDPRAAAGAGGAGRPPGDRRASLAQTGDALSGLADMMGIKPDDSNPLGQLRVGFEAVKEGRCANSRAGGEASAVAEMNGLADEILRDGRAGSAAGRERGEGGRAERARGGDADDRAAPLRRRRRRRRSEPRMR